jgi:DNA mismatch repair protein MutS2
MIYPSNFEDKVGFSAVRHLIQSHCMSPLGVAQCEAMTFSPNFDVVTKLLAQTNEFLSIIQSSVEFPLNYFFDLTPSLTAIRASGSFMTEDDLFNLRRSLDTIGNIVKFFALPDGESKPQFPALTAMVASMQAFPAIIAQIDRVLDKFGHIKDNASPELHDIRRSIASTTASINGILRRIMSAGRQSGILDKDVAPSMRDGRLVIPVSPANKRKFHGIVHDESATGKTIFIEPAEIVEANNNIRELQSDERREIIRILVTVADAVRPDIDNLLDSYRILGLIDFVRAKALFATDIDAKMPHIEREPQIDWYHAVHPGLLLSLREQGKQVVPLNISLSSADRILLISGPNAGGKSVCLKTVGIIQYMTQCGIIPPVYENSHIGIFSDLFIDIGDEQSIEDDLSTYSSHLTNMKMFLNHGSAKSLVLIDEFGGGTEPQIGGAIAQSVLGRLNSKQVFGVITTHYQNLKHFADATDGIVNGAMLYDRQRMRPLFQLSIGYPGSSFAVEIARKIGLPQDVISEAESIVGSDYINMDKYLLDIARDRRYWENKRSDIHAKEKKLDAIAEQYNESLEKLKAERKEIIKAAKTEAAEIIASSNSSIERTISEIKKAQAEKEKTKDVRQELEEFKQRLASADEEGIKLRPLATPRKRKQPQKPQQQPSSAPIAAGDFVTLDDGDSVGQITELSGKTATVTFGNFKSRVSVSRLKRTLRHPKTVQKAASFVSSSTSDELRSRQLQFKEDIDVRGMRADEAVQAVTYFIDDALQFNSQRVRILHGTGTGALRECIRQYLSTVRGVKSFHDEHVQLGGAGITVVEF